ncbi:hypothetical protein [Candidatus Nanohalovita haloferacivicina]|uniref:hypothetical protein n=1 Tax=Candidatus Nanohalovita haloferacivicina TaxID=2978046 RepID=UPI00325FA96A|nr:hypothetical protein HBNXNv_0337 [Candidatus Nanohalobia archaeon BNXNv]
MPDFYDFLYEQLDEPDSLALIATGKSNDERRNQWLHDEASEFRDYGVDVEVGWLGIPGQDGVDYDIVDNAFEWEGENSLDMERNLFRVPKPGVLRYNPENPRNDPLENYVSIAKRIEKDVDAALMTEVHEDAAGDLPDVEDIAYRVSSDVAGQVVPVVGDQGSESLFVRKFRYPQN